jgi:hypothetical protein
MRLVYHDPYTLRGAVHEMAGLPPVATRESDLPIPVDVYQLEAVKGRGYREVALKSNRRKGRQK